MRSPHPISLQVFLRLINLITTFAMIGLLGVTPMHAAQSSAQLSCSPGALKFGAVTVGQTETLVVELTNNGASSVTLSQINLSNAEFNASVGSLPAVLQAGQSLSVSVAFAPTTRGWTKGGVTFVSNASNSSLTLDVSGSGDTSSSISASPSNISFGSQTVGSVSTVSLVLTNTRSWAVAISGLQTTGTGFSVSGPTLPLSLTAGQSVTFTVAFAPQAAGTIGGSILVLGPSVAVPLAGTGAVAGQLTLSPTSLNFGNVNVGSSGNEVLTLVASGSAITISSEASSSAQFSVTGASFPLTIPAGQSVSLAVVFTPQNSGTAAGALSFASNAANSLPAESVSGTGVTPVYSVGLTWTASTSEVAGYNVYRGAAASGPFTKINPSLNSTTAYTDTTVATGQTYYYVTTAVNSSDVESSPSTPAEASVP